MSPRGRPLEKAIAIVTGGSTGVGAATVKALASGVHPNPCPRGRSIGFAAAIVFLCKHESAYITGASIRVDGGLSLNTGQGA